MKQTRTQERNLIADYVWAHCRGRTVDPYGITAEIHDHWGIRTDHHPVAYLLDELACQGKIERTYRRIEEYKIPTE